MATGKFRKFNSHKISKVDLVKNNLTTKMKNIF